MPVTNFSRNITALRSDHDMTQTELAKAINVTQTTVSGWETRGKIPNQNEIINALCGLFRCSQQDLFGFTDGYYAKRMGTVLQPTPSDSYAPIAGNVAAGEAREVFELGYESHWVRPDILESYPDGFFLVIKGDSMDRVLPDGCFAFVAPGPVMSGDVAAVKVNGDEATVKRVTVMDGLVVLSPESSNPEHKRRVIDSTDPDAPSVRLIGKVVWADLSL